MKIPFGIPTAKESLSSDEKQAEELVCQKSSSFFSSLAARVFFLLVAAWRFVMVIIRLDAAFTLFSWISLNFFKSQDVDSVKSKCDFNSQACFGVRCFSIYRTL